MAEKLEDLNLPQTVVARIIKEALPPGVAITKEARTGLAKVASVFVLYVTSASANVAKKSNRRTLTAHDVLEAMEDIEFEKFVDPLKEALLAYKNNALAKKQQTAASKKPAREVDKAAAAIVEEVGYDEQADESVEQEAG